jgi:hypothetical protein
MSENDCKRIQELIQMQLDGSLPEPEKKMVDLHQGRCASCAGFAQAMAKIHVVLKETIPVSGTPAFSDLKLSRLGKPSFLPDIFRSPVFGGGLAFALVILLVVLVFPRGQNPSAPKSLAEVASFPMTDFLLSQVKSSVLTGKSEDELHPVPRNTNFGLEEKTFIRVNENGEGVLTHGTSSIIQLKSDTDAMILASGIKVKSGNIWVAYKGTGKKLQIETPSAVLGVLGTQFGVRVAKDGSTKVWCSEGKVWVKGISGETTKIITVGEEVKVAASGAISPVDRSTEPPPTPIDSTTLGEEWMKKATPYDAQGK